MGMENEPTIQDDLPEKSTTQYTPKQIRRQRLIVAGVIAILVIILAGLGTAIFFLAKNPEAATVVRDIFIILMAFESLILGVVLTILVFQLARLTNLLQNEIKPILDSTNDTMNTLRGTTIFLSENLVQPVMKLNEYLAVIQKLAGLLGLSRKK